MDRHTLNHEQAAADLPAYVLDVLSRDEAEAVAAHLDVCSACRREQARLEWTLGLLGTSVDSLEPSNELRSRFLAQISEPAPQPKARLISVGRGGSRLAAIGLAAAAVLVAGLLTWVILLRSDLNSTSDRLHQARQEQSASVSVLASMATAIPLVADSSPNAYGTLYIGTNKDQALLVVEKLTPTPANRMYQVWLVNQSTRVSAGLFTVDQSGSATVMIKAPSPLSAYQSLGITSEPSPSGSSWPTGPRVIGCSLH